MLRRTFQTITADNALPGGGGEAAAPTTTPVPANPVPAGVTTPVVDTAAAGAAFDRRALGGNLQPVDRASDPTVPTLVQALSPTMLFCAWPDRRCAANCRGRRKSPSKRFAVRRTPRVLPSHENPWHPRSGEAPIDGLGAAAVHRQDTDGSAQVRRAL